MSSLAPSLLLLHGMEPAIDLVRGTVVAGAYRLEHKVGEGGMSEVWEATDLERHIRVALKMLLPKAAHNLEIVARFRREAELLARIDSVHVPHLYDFLEDPSFGHVLVQELLQGEVVARVLDQRRLSIVEARQLGMALARVMAELHRAGIMHRDLKPGNVILEPLPGGGLRTMVIDFGVSRLSTQQGDDDTRGLAELTHVGRAVGTIPYMAPEQILGSRDVTAAVDLYAIGAILFRAVAGRHAFGELQGLELARAKLLHEAPPLEIDRDDPMAVGLATVVARLLRRQPLERHESADDLLVDLVALGQRPQPEAQSEQPTWVPVDLGSLSMVIEPPPLPPPASSPWRMIAFALAAGVFVGAAADRRLAEPTRHVIPVSNATASEMPPRALTAPPPGPLCTALVEPMPAVAAVPAAMRVGRQRRHRRPVSATTAPPALDPEPPVDPAIGFNPDLPLDPTDAAGSGHLPAMP